MNSIRIFPALLHPHPDIQLEVRWIGGALRPDELILWPSGDATAVLRVQALRHIPQSEPVAMLHPLCEFLGWMPEARIYHSFPGGDWDSWGLVAKKPQKI